VRTDSVSVTGPDVVDVSNLLQFLLHLKETNIQ